MTRDELIKELRLRDKQLKAKSYENTSLKQQLDTAVEALESIEFCAKDFVCLSKDNDCEEYKDYGYDICPHYIAKTALEQIRG